VIGSFPRTTLPSSPTPRTGSAQFPKGSTFPKGTDAMIDGRVGWGGSSQGPFAEFLMIAPDADERVPVFSRCCAAGR
jgi:hypothetical protein